MKNLSTIEDAISLWARTTLGSGVPVIWMHQNAPRPDAPYVTLHLRTIKQKGVDAFVGDELVGNRDFGLFMQGFGLNAAGFLEQLYTSLGKVSTQLYLRNNDIAFRDKLSDINDISEVIDNRWEERSQLDLLFGFAQVDSDDEGSIEHANIEIDVFNPDLNTITVIHESI